MFAAIRRRLIVRARSLLGMTDAGRPREKARQLGDAAIRRASSHIPPKADIALGFSHKLASQHSIKIMGG
jgi:hypothetical protein